MEHFSENTTDSHRFFLEISDGARHRSGFLNEPIPFPFGNPYRPVPFDDTIVALATPSGESALAMIRVSGPASLSLATEVFQNPEPKPRYANVADYRGLSGDSLDQVVFLFYPETASFTGEPVLEICPHGNPLIVQRIIEDLCQRGCRMAEPGEFTRTAFLNGRMDLSQAEAVMDLIHARSERAIEAARRQLAGSVGKTVEALLDRLLGVVSHIEAYIDFPEEDLPPEDAAGPAHDLALLRRELSQLISTSHYSTLLHEGIRTVILGAPNAGKSSLLNALAGQERAIVSPEPGTTRDFIEERIMVGPYGVRIIDTAGLHEAGSDIERMGITKTLEQIEAADFHIVVADSTVPAPVLPEAVTNRLIAARALVVENKCDLPASVPMPAFLPGNPRCRVSVKTSDGFAELWEQLRICLETGIEVPSEDKVIVSARHAEALRRANASLADAQEKMAAQTDEVLVASDLRDAMDAIGEITGKVDNERMLDKLFANFCIGK